MLKIDNIYKDYGDFVLGNINLEVEDGEYFVLLGRSGSGKSQLLETISGLTSPDSGRILLDGIDISSARIQNRAVGLVFQDFALFPHLSVYDNIAYPLRMARLDKHLIGNKVENIAGEINIVHLLGRKPPSLSGGEKQRVAVARTLVRSPKIILLDEPMASIDTPLRDELRRLLRKINRSGMTMLHVTHDYREAIRLADRVGVIHNGRIIQCGKPAEVFDKPVNRFVARFAGIQNFFKVSISREGDRFIGKGHNNFRFILPGDNYPADGLIMMKSGDLQLHPEGEGPGINCARGVISEINRAEFGYEAYIDAGETFYVTFTPQLFHEMELTPGKIVDISFSPDSIKVI